MIAIVKYNAGNITSVKNAVERLGYSCLVTDDETLLQQAEKVIFPGVGEASSAMKYLKEKGLWQDLTTRYEFGNPKKTSKTSEKGISEKYFRKIYPFQLK